MSFIEDRRMNEPGRWYEKSNRPDTEIKCHMISLIWRIYSSHIQTCRCREEDGGHHRWGSEVTIVKSMLRECRMQGSNTGRNGYR